MIVFSRRFGLTVLSLGSQNLSDTIKFTLDKQGVCLIGVGFESRFVKPFVEGGFFSGELYVDNDMACYKALDYQRFSFFDLMKRPLSATFRSRKAKADGGWGSVGT